MTLQDLGYNNYIQKTGEADAVDSFDVGRVVAEHKERYVVKSLSGEFDAEITGNLRFTAQSREDFPAVGDWVAMTIFDSDQAIIHDILPRFSVIRRKSVGQEAASQIIAANIDFGFIVQAVGYDFNLNRLDRYLTICYASEVSPVILLTKTDLISKEEINDLLAKINLRHPAVPILPVSNQNREGYEKLDDYLQQGKTCCLLGSSGVGKSTMVNNLSLSRGMKTGNISQSTGKGRHVTSHRELVVLDKGGVIIDNPGMREVGLAESAGGIEATFDTISELAKKCKYKDCSHTSEDGCCVIQAVDRGELDEAVYLNFMKMEKERAHYDTSSADKRKREKQFGKIMKNYKKNMKRHQFD